MQVYAPDAEHDAQLLALRRDQAAAELARLVARAQPAAAEAGPRRAELETQLDRLLAALATARTAGVEPALIADADRHAEAWLEEYAALAEWAKACHGRRWDRGLVRRYLLSRAWAQGNMVDVLALADDALCSTA